MKLKDAPQPVFSESPDRLFSQATMHDIHAAALRAGIDADDILRELDPELRASLPTADTSAARLLTALAELNRLRLPDGSIPLLTVLRTAELLARPRAEAAVFAEARFAAESRFGSYTVHLSGRRKNTLLGFGAAALVIGGLGAIYFFWHRFPSNTASPDTASVMADNVWGSIAQPRSIPLQHARVILIGTNCAARTNDLGFFDLHDCQPRDGKPLRNPRIRVQVTERSWCECDVILGVPNDVRIRSFAGEVDGTCCVATEAMSLGEFAASTPRLNEDDCRERCDSVCQRCIDAGAVSSVVDTFCTSDGTGRKFCLFGDHTGWPRCNDPAFVRQCESQ